MLNRSIQSTAKNIKTQLEQLSRDKAAMPEPQQAKMRKLMQDFAAALQVGSLVPVDSATPAHSKDIALPFSFCQTSTNMTCTSNPRPIGMHNRCSEVISAPVTLAGHHGVSMPLLFGPPPWGCWRPFKSKLKAGL